MTHWHQGGPHVRSAWGEFFLDETQKGAGMGDRTRERMVTRSLYHWATTSSLL
jgi:hypothetical protein